ncbi:vancomycin high temperature exclusion protein [Nocardia sp. NBC_01009]|uniref:SanA/YdcF family protein n=1 Tax=Nocardia sp. NBC_01009 TaxID=2975996 RepID=UPI003865437C|nr:YdcF family protein [Nocardia sp. NBC_01009]
MVDDQESRGGQSGSAAVRRRRVCRVLESGIALVAGLVLVVVGANVRLWMMSSGHRFEPATAPAVPVVIVPGAKVGPDGAPMAYLRGRLDVAIELWRAGKAREILVSGDAAGTSGDEVASMTRYLVDHGVDPALVRSDGEGLSTRETCARAERLFDIDRAIIVTQYRHVPRAVALCRAEGIDADGVAAYCECRRMTVVRNNIREWLAAPKAVVGLILR